MALVQGKAWGQTELLLSTPMIEVHRITIQPQSYCSMHKHDYKWNSFYVLSGTLEIVVEKSDYDLTDMTHLAPGDFTTVKPGEYHRFENNSGDVVTALEIYYLEPLSADIVRKDCGGQF